MKTCTRCRQELPEANYWRDASKVGGYDTYCKDCRRAIRAKSHEENREQRLTDMRAYHLKRTFGITLEDYDAMLERQGGRCAICRTSEPGTRLGRWCIDHDHRTDAIRSLLCNACNSGLGAFGDNPAVLMAAVSYLFDHGSVSLAEVP